MPIRTGDLTATAPVASRTSELPEHRLEELEFLVNAAYYRNATAVQDWVPLQTLRVTIDQLAAEWKVPAFDRADVDHVIAWRMAKTQKLHLAPESNTKCLTNERVEASIRWGGETLHLVAVSL